jgi:hypothetical protein
MDAQNRLTFHHPQTGEVPKEIEEALAGARTLIGEARARTARVSLLFGPVSGPDRGATLTLIHLENTLKALDAWPVPELDKYREELAGARKYLADFNTSALREARGCPWWRRRRWILWLRRRTRRLSGKPWRREQSSSN